MPKYRRYGYVIVQRFYDHARFGERILVASTIVGFHHNPRKANQHLDKLIATRQGDFTEFGPDETPLEDRKENVGYPIRDVFIKYEDGSYDIFRLEAWFVWVGKE